MKMTKIILGSQSPRRRQLLDIMGFPYEVRVSDSDEDFPDEMNIQQVAEYLATKKAMVLLPGLSDDEVLITADSTVICNQKIYNKPGNQDEAQQMLRELSGKKHEVVTGVWIGSRAGRQESFSAKTYVVFAHLTDAEIFHYVTNHKPFDKAGGYGIQDWIGITLVEEIQGSYTNVMGLPTHEVYRRLKTYLSVS